MRRYFRLFILYFSLLFSSYSLGNICPEIREPVRGKHSLQHIVNKQQGIYGIDVSHHQGIIDWKQVKQAGVTFAYMKATEGTNWIDRCFQYNWETAPQAGVIRGAYHFFRGHTDPLLQAKLFVDQVKPTLTRYDLPPVLDIEETLETKYLPPILYAARAKTWLLYVERELGVLPIVYTNPHFWRTYLLGDPAFRRYPLWLATTKNAPVTPPPWEDWIIWQFSHQGDISGVANEVDLNVFAGDGLRFAKVLLG